MKLLTNLLQKIKNLYNNDHAGTSNIIYSFEQKNRRQFAKPDDEDLALKEFKQRMNLIEIEVKDNRELLLNFILNYPKTITYYQKRRDLENTYRWLFIILSLCLLIIIPIIIGVITNSKGNLSDSSSIATQITWVITGLLGIQKSLSSWLDQRKIIGNFWKAESELKTKLYAFEDKWKGKASIDNKLKVDFLLDVKIANNDALAIIQTEQDSFFAAEIYPSINLGDLLKEAGETATTIVNAHKLPVSGTEIEKTQDAKEASIKIAQLTAEIVAWKKLIAEKRTQLESTDAVKEKAKAAAISSALTAHESKLLDAEANLIIATSKVEVLLRAS